MNNFSMDDFSMWHNHQQDTISLESDEELSSLQGYEIDLEN